jgi:hypothetical protein
MAESELGVLASQCLDRRIADKQILTHEVNAWQHHRNNHHAKANWQFKRLRYAFWINLTRGRLLRVRLVENAAPPNH